MALRVRSVQEPSVKPRAVPLLKILAATYTVMRGLGSWRLREPAGVGTLGDAAGSMLGREPCQTRSHSALRSPPRAGARTLTDLAIRPPENSG